MKSKFFFLSIVTALVFSSCTKDDSNVVAPLAPSGKSSKSIQSIHIGDWAQYQRYDLDANSNVILSSRTTFTRTVLSTNEVIGGYTGVTKVIDSIYSANGTFLRTEIKYFKVDNGNLYMLNFGNDLDQHFGFTTIPDLIEFSLIGKAASSTSTTLSATVTVNPLEPAFASMSGAFRGKNYVYPTATNKAYNCYKNTWVLDKAEIGTDADIPVEFCIGGTDADIPIEFGIGTDADIPVEFVIVKEKINTSFRSNVIIPGEQYELIGYKPAQ